MKQLQRWSTSMIFKALSSTVRVGAIASVSAIGLAGFLASPTQAQEALTNSNIQFPEETIVEFEIGETHGYYQSTIGVVNLKTGVKTPLFIEVRGYDSPEASVPGRDDTGSTPDFPGTVAGGTIVNGNREASNLYRFTFEANTPYALYLDSVDPNTKQPRPSFVSTNVNAASFAGSLTGGVSGNQIKWDDSGLPKPGKDSDFDDFTLIAGGFTLEACPFRE